MNTNQLFNMFGRMLTRHLMNWGTNKAIDRMSKSGGKTPAQSAQNAKAMRQNSKRMRQAIDMIRRMSR
ncbi:hypothetical protein H4P12_08150 [Paracoccus sp. 11-3]|uniref:Uncharacterized protein n=1 Tax=Paracoccus amoyensis TaxID=2760093 RepID=A0A926JD93_9RHOB|nr:hypothetical protein [Paracoccus amoyensis]MBC9246683.1 hypothetical protein [Paracoccus amoyensis]